MSGAQIISSISQFPNPLIMIGITMEKIVMKAWAVMITLQIWSSPRRVPGWPSSAQMKCLSQVETDLYCSGLNSDHVGLLVVEQMNP